jgi:hypothetical protein
MLQRPSDKPKKKLRKLGRKLDAEKKAHKRLPSQDEVIRVIHAERGLLTEIAARFGVSRNTIRAYASDRAEVALALKDAREAMGDTAEKKLYELIEAGDVRCITYYLSTVHRNRGYGIRKDEALDIGDKSTHVQTINIVAIPHGQFLPPDEARRLMSGGNGHEFVSGSAPVSAGGGNGREDVVVDAEPVAPVAGSDTAALDAVADIVPDPLAESCLG